jgi:hypothetical protein
MLNILSEETGVALMAIDRTRRSLSRCCVFGISALIFPRFTAAALPVSNRVESQGCFGFTFDESEDGTLHARSGNKAIDAVIRSEIGSLAKLLDRKGIVPKEFVTYEFASGLRNLKTVPGRHPTTAYTIVLGRPIFEDLNRQQTLALLTPVLLGHEIAHCFQYRDMFDYVAPTIRKEKRSAPIRDFELMADYFAGSYIRYREKVIGDLSYSALLPIAQMFFQFGTYEFHDTQFHGTGAERFTAFKLGYEFSSVEVADLFSAERGIEFVTQHLYAM